MRKNAKVFVTLLLFVLVVSSLSITYGARKTIISLGHLGDENHTWHRASLKFKEEVEKNSNGQIEVRVFPNEQLGAEKDLIVSIKTGAADMGIFGETLTTFGANKTMMMATPYLLRSSAHLRAVADGPIGDEIEQQIIDKVNLRPIAYFERGPRELTSNKPIRTPEDLNGMIIRVPNVPLFVRTWKALGAKPTPMAFSEVFTSLQQGTIDGQENPYDLIKSASFYEVQKYLNRTSHVRGWIYVCIGERKFQSFSPELQKVVLDAGKVMQDYENQLFKAEYRETEKFLQEKMTFVEVDQEAFIEKAKTAVLANLDEEQREIYNKIVSMDVK